MSRGSEKNWGSGWGWGASKRVDPKGQPLPREQYPEARAEVADRLLTATGLCGGLWWQLPREHGPRLGPGPSWHVSHRKGSPDWVEEHRAPGRVQCPAGGPSSLPGKRPAMWGRGAVLSVTQAGQGEPDRAFRIPCQASHSAPGGCRASLRSGQAGRTPTACLQGSGPRERPRVRAQTRTGSREVGA